MNNNIPCNSNSFIPSFEEIQHTEENNSSKLQFKNEITNFVKIVFPPVNSISSLFTPCFETKTAANVKQKIFNHVPNPLLCNKQEDVKSNIKSEENIITFTFKDLVITSEEDVITVIKEDAINVEEDVITVIKEDAINVEEDVITVIKEDVVTITGITVDLTEEEEHLDLKDLIITTEEEVTIIIDQKPDTIEQKSGKNIKNKKNIKKTTNKKCNKRAKRKPTNSTPTTTPMDGYQIGLTPELRQIIQASKVVKSKKPSNPLDKGSGRSVPMQKLQLPNLGLAKESWAIDIANHELPCKLPSIEVNHGSRTYVIDISAEMANNLRGKRGADHHISLNLLTAVLNAKAHNAVAKAHKTSGNLPINYKVQRPGHPEPTIFKFVFLAEPWHSKQQARLITAFSLSHSSLLKEYGSEILMKDQLELMETIKIDHEEEFLSASS